MLNVELSETGLMLLVIPALYSQFGQILVPKRAEPRWQSQVASEASS